MTGFTFKREPRETGLRNVANPYPAVQIKLAGKRVGLIRGPNPNSGHDGWKASFMVKSDTHPGWKWIRMAHEDATEADARAWLQRQADNIAARYKLHQQEDI